MEDLLNILLLICRHILHFYLPDLDFPDMQKRNYFYHKSLIILVMM
ncbi:hypothetical protein CSC12_0599 [Klebsiella michiganensis]|nr:hypothetical protein CSC12_0599 [Klebsiella michiganensis]